jgi:hypothetical protein
VGTEGFQVEGREHTARRPVTQALSGEGEFDAPAAQVAEKIGSSHTSPSS